MSRPLYLDYNATNPLDQRVFDSMRPYFLEQFGNAGSRTHSHGQEAKQAVDAARQRVAMLVGARPEEVVFTSGATEANNLTLLGLIPYGLKQQRRHVIASAIEHKSVLEPLERMMEAGYEVELLPVSEGGYVDIGMLRERLRSDTLLISVMHGNNETGVLQPVDEIAKAIEGRDILFHVDAAQTFGKQVEQLRTLPYDFLSISAHKICGPKGIGALCVRRKSNRKRVVGPIMLGGGQEGGLRPGTLPVPLIVGLGTAADLASNEYQARRAAAKCLKDDLLTALSAVDYHVNGDPHRTMQHVLNVSFPGVDSEALMMALRDDLSISNGAACTSSSYSPSHVLAAMGFSEDRITSAVRISWGPGIANIPGKKIADTVKILKLF